MTLTNSRSVHETAIAVEATATPGTAETTPIYYLLVEAGSGNIQINREFDRYKATAYNRATLSIAKAYKPSIDINTWGFYDENGTGYLMTAALGADAKTTPTGASTARQHVITISDTILPSYTIWDKTLNTEQVLAGAQCDKLTISCPQDAPMGISASFVGSNVNTVATFGEAAYLSEADLAKAVSASQNVITYGLSNSEITDLTFDIENNINQDEGIIQGGKYPSSVVTGNDKKISGSFDAWDYAGEHLLAFWEGGTSSPDATTPEERPNYVSVSSKWTGSNIEKPIAAAAADGGNSGSTTATSGGTSTLTAGAVFTIEITTADTQDVFKWKKDSGDYTEGVDTDTDAITLSDGVTIKWDAITGAAVGDIWTITCYVFDYYINISVPSIQLTGITASDSDNRLKYSVTFEAVKTSATPITITCVNIEDEEWDVHA